MNKHPRVYKTAAGPGVLKLVCMAVLFCSFAVTATAAEWKEPSYSPFKMPPATITGKVTDSKNAPMEGVNVTIKGSKRGAVTNAAGMYTIANVPENATLVFSFTGFADKEVKVTGTAPINVSLTEAVNGLSDVVVVGYGTVAKKDLTGSIAQVKATALENENPRSVQDILRGNVAGIDVGFDASTKGSNASLLIRGKGSLKASNDPLIVLNGVIYSGSLADINPNDIATVDILKDASAAAVYGAQSSNGVIAITTKRGKIGKPQITFNDNIGLNKVTNVPRLLNADEFIRWRQDALWAMANFDSTSKPGIQYKFYNPNELPSSISLTQWLGLGGNTQQSNAADPLASWLYRLNLNDIEIANYKAGKSIDFNKVYYNPNSLQHDHTISISQRREDYFYYVSLGYLQNQSITNGEKPYETYRASVNLEANVAKYLTVGMYLGFSERNESGIAMNRDYVYKSSPYGNLYNADGTPTFSVNNDPAVSNNPIYDQTMTDRSYKYDNIISTFFVRGKLPFGFSYESSFRPRLGFSQEYNHVGTTPAQGGNPTASRKTTFTYNWLLDNTIRWNKSFGNHNIGLQFTQTAEKNQYWETVANASGFSPVDALSYHNIQSGTLLPTVSSNDTKTTGAAYTARATYDFKKRYYLTGTFRRDGYSGFGANNPWANFYSAALQWSLSDESFMRSTSKWLDYAKVRLSYGETGNRSIPDPTAVLYTLGTGSYSYLNTGGTPVNLAIIYASALANPDLKWEKKGGVNAGLDFSILRNKISGSVDYYINRTSNLIVQRTIPPVSGFTSIWTNLGNVQNTGIEISVNTQNMKIKDFEWNSSISFWLNRNKILHLYGETPVYDATGKQIGMRENSDTANGWFIGHSINEIYDYKVIGVWQTSEAALAKTFGQFPGDFKIQDTNGDGKVTAADKVFQGYTDPKFSFNIRNEFRLFRDFEFSFSLYGRIGRQTGAGYRYNNDGFANRYNFLMRPYWTPSNPINDYARISSYNASVGSANYINSSFVRLNNISLAYNVPADVVKRWGIGALKVYANIVNAAVFTSWNWYDPENQNVTPRTYNFGLNLTL